MCGIFGYVGEGKATPVLLDGLKKLEYRGYDSSGIYVSDFGVVKAVGPVENLVAKVTEDISGTSGIAHTRWATHGIPSEENSHPHHDESEQIWLVHNGIIENYQKLKGELKEKGVKFYSETDTEVLAKLIGSLYEDDLQKAVLLALEQVQGAYGLAVMDKNDPQKIVLARMGSPIVIGLSKDGNFVSSDPSALLSYTKDVVYLDDGEIAVITKDDYKVRTIKGGKEQIKKVEKVEWDYSQVQKGGFEHFMLKEIFEAPEVIENTIRGRLQLEEGRAKLGGLEDVLSELSTLRRLQIVGCGSAYYAGEVGSYMLREYAHLPVEVTLGSEYRYTKMFPDKQSALVAVSQSGETADTLESLRCAKSQGILTLGVINGVGSTISRETTAGVYNHAGPEIAVASTKAFISQLTVFALLTLLLGRERGMSRGEGQEIVSALIGLPEVLKTVLDSAPKIKAMAEKYAKYDNGIFIGRKLHAPIAHEGALKLKEVSYMHAEGYAGGELKHGPIALLDSNFPVIAIVPQDDVYDKMCSNIEEVKVRQSPVLALITAGDTKISSLVDDVIEIPKVHPIVQPIVSTVPLHLFAYYVGLAKGLNVDRPRNLAKSVTVE
jgi:glucosamine--fructose-6-phosphate aminotransferase (isomerizing)